MAEKSLNAILKMRYDSYTNWMSANPILKKGETAVVLVESESANVQPIVLSKVGNGTDTFSALPWSSANAADVYEWAKQENKPTYTASEVSAVSYIDSQSLTEAQKKTARNNIDADSKVVVTFNFSVSPAVITDPEGYDGAKILADIQAGKSVYAKVNKTGSQVNNAVLPYYSGADSTNTTSGGFLYFRSAAPSVSTSGDYKSLYFPCIRVYVQGTGTVNPAPYNLDEGLVDVATYGYTRNKFSSIDTNIDNLTTNIDKKLDKVSIKSVAYTTDADGAQSTLGYSVSSDNTAGQLAVRAADGGVNVPLTPGSNSRATSKYYVDNKFVSYNTFTDNNLKWGGTNKTNATPIDAAIIPSIGGNKFELCRAAGITVEYTNDSGATWTDYGLTDVQKIAQLSIKNNSDKIYIGKKTNTKAAVTDQVRVTVNAQQCGVYTLVKKILINISTNGASGCKVTVEGSKDASTWTSLNSDATIAGWPGWNSLPITAYFSFGSVGNYQYARLTFSITGVSSNYNSNLDIRNIIFVGVENWRTPSNISETGHLYSYDYNGNATFPENVSSKNIICSESGYFKNLYVTPDGGTTSGVDIYGSNGNITSKGTITASKFIGDGSGLTNLPSSGGATEYTATIPSTGWTQNTDTESYSVEVAVTGLKADYPTAPIVDFDTSGYTNMSMLKSDLALWAKVLKITTAAGKIIVYANEQPGTELPIRIKVIE